MAGSKALNEKLTGLLAGGIKASSIVGTGYKNARKVASEYIRTQIANADLSEENKVSTVLVTSSGAAFKKESLATSSRAYNKLNQGDSDLFYNKKITDFGVWPSAFGDGYEIYVVAK